MTSRRGPALPNMRLKLTGGDRSKGSGVLCAGAHQTNVEGKMRERAGRPQLKRDPLGSAAMGYVLCFQLQ